jgi:hypothetical protein
MSMRVHYLQVERGALSQPHTFILSECQNRLATCFDAELIRSKTLDLHELKCDHTLWLEPPSQLK